MCRIGAGEWPRPGYEWGEPGGSEAAATGAPARRSPGMSGLRSRSPEWHGRAVQGEPATFALRHGTRTGAPMTVVEPRHSPAPRKRVKNASTLFCGSRPRAPS